MEGVTRHHVLFRRSWYKTQQEKRLRNYNGLVIPLDEEVHKELHANIPPPHKPSKNLIVGALVMLDFLPSDMLKDPLAVVDTLAGHMLNSRTKLGEQIGMNLIEQTVYIARGME